MVKCPQSWGVPEKATVQDMMGKVMELENGSQHGASERANDPA